MKKNYVLFFLLTFSVTFAFAQVAGTWKMSPQAAALGVGPALGDISWWSNNEADVATRACYFNDEYVFSEDGTFQNVQQEETWDEAWQGVPDGCGAPVAPHDGSNAATWAYDAVAGTITLNGVGSYLGLAKVVNGGELPNVAVPSSIVYMAEFNATNDTMTINIEIAGGAYWRFILTTNAGAPPAPSVTFNVNMSYQVELGNFDPATEFVDIAGNFNGWPPSGTTTNELTEGPAYVYSTTIEDFTVGEELEFKFRINSDWDNAEFPGPGGSNRTYTVKEGLNIITVWYNDETPPPPGMLADFEDGTWGVFTNVHVMACGDYDNPELHAVDETFVVIDNPDQSGINTSNKVLQFNRWGTDVGAQPWAGFWADCVPPINTTETQYVHYMVWKPMVSPNKFKLETPAVEVGSTNEQTVTNGWQDMVFNFSEAAAGEYGRGILMPDFQDPFATAGVVVMYIDNILISSDPDPYTGIWNNKAEVISIYPNPFVSSVNIVLTNDMNSVVISNLVGQKLYEINNVAKGTINIDASILDKGVYIISLTDKNDVTTSSKLMKN